jgi:hypothetical protein
MRLLRFLISFLMVAVGCFSYSTAFGDEIGNSVKEIDMIDKGGAVIVLGQSPRILVRFSELNGAQKIQFILNQKKISNVLVKSNSDFSEIPSQFEAELEFQQPLLNIAILKPLTENANLLSVLAEIGKRNNGPKLDALIVTAYFMPRSEHPENAVRWYAIKSGSSLVEVTAKMKGSGVIVLVDGQPRILTNSHILFGQKSAVLKLFTETDFNREIKASVEFDNPLADFVILKPLINDNNLVQELTKQGRANINFCKLNSASCINGMEWATAEADFNLPLAVAVVNSKIINVPNITPWVSGLVKDDYIAGIYSNIIASPIFSRPGMSGGAIFDRLRFRGLITKVQLDATPLAYSIPVEEIAKILNVQYFESVESSIKKLPSARWKFGKSGEGIEVMFNGQLIEATSISGTIKSGGGEIGSGGDSLDQSPYWHIRSPRIGFNIENLLQIADLMTANPFVHKKSQLKINGEEIAFVAIQNLQQSRSSTYATPSLARIIRLNIDSDSHQQQFQIIKKGELAKEMLTQRRLQLLRTLRKPKYARYYLKQKRGEIAIPDEPGNAYVLDNTFSFTLADRNSLTEKMEKSNKAFIEFNQTLAELQYTLDQNGYTSSWPFQVKSSPSLALDAKFRQAKDKVNDSEFTEFDFKWAYGLDEFSMFLKENQQDQNSIEVKFERESQLDELSIRFKSNLKGYRAVMIFDEADMGKLERIYIESPNKIFEFVSCTIGKECIR